MTPSSVNHHLPGSFILSFRPRPMCARLFLAVRSDVRLPLSLRLYIGTVRIAPGSISGRPRSIRGTPAQVHSRPSRLISIACLPVLYYWRGREHEASLISLNMHATSGSACACSNVSEHAGRVLARPYLLIAVLRPGTRGNTAWSATTSSCNRLLDGGG